MKKLLIFMLVLGLASVANAVTVSFESGGNNAVDIDILVSSSLTVDVVVDTAVVSGFQVTIGGSTTSAGANATAAAVGTLNAGYTTAFTGNLRNGMTNWGAGAARYVLIDRISGNPSAGSPVAANAISYTFTLNIPGGASIGDTFTLTAYAGTPTVGGPPPYSYLVDGAAPGATSNLVVTAIPEPTTVALLGLGSLFLRRRRKL